MSCLQFLTDANWAQKLFMTKGTHRYLRLLLVYQDFWFGSRPGFVVACFCCCLNFEVDMLRVLASSLCRLCHRGASKANGFRCGGELFQRISNSVIEFGRGSMHCWHKLACEHPFGKAHGLDRRIALTFCRERMWSTVWRFTPLTARSRASCERLL